MPNQTIYIQLLNEGSTAYRPTQGELISDDTFRVLPTENYDPEDEEWEFLPGDIVKCVLEEKSGNHGKHMVLVARCKVE
jgi:hypothetical protein